MVKAPPMMGPVARPSWPMPMLTPMKSACFRVGRTVEMVVMAPLASPAEPTPAITRPMMNIGDDLAAPHMADPTSKITKKTRKVHCMHDDLVRTGFTLCVGTIREM